MRLLTLTYLIAISHIATGQYSDGKVFNHTRPNEFNRHFKQIPGNIDAAVSIINSDLTNRGREYFKNETERLAVTQFSGTYYMLLFRWRLLRKNNVFMNHMISNGSTTDKEEIIRIVLAALHRKLNEESFSILELSRLYSKSNYKTWIDSLRNVSSRDTVFGSWFVRKNVFAAYSYSAWFEVIEKISDGAVRLKIIRLRTGDRDVDKINRGDNTLWKLGDEINWKNGDLTNWKEVMKLFYSDD
jgi:hypothetical protein